MSRIGVLPITIPSGVTLTVEHNLVKVAGPKGELSQPIARELSLDQEGSQLTIVRPNNQRRNRSQHGLARTLVQNMVQGVTKGHEKVLEIHGVGYRAAMEGKTLVLSVGYSHQVRIQPDAGVEIEVKAEDRSRITRVHVRGIDKAQVGQLAADIRKVRRPDPYKGKGIRYMGEVVRLKPGKRAGRK